MNNIPLDILPSSGRNNFKKPNYISFILVNVCVAELSRSRPAALPVQLCDRGPLHVLHQGGRCPQAQEPSHQRHAEERPQAAVDGPAER